MWSTARRHPRHEIPQVRGVRRDEQDTARAATKTSRYQGCDCRNYEAREKNGRIEQARRDQAARGDRRGGWRMLELFTTRSCTKCAALEDVDDRAMRAHLVNVKC